MNVTLVTRRNGLGILGYLFTKTIRHHDVSAMTTSFSGILQIVSYCGPKMEKSITTYQISDVLKLHVTSE